MDISRGVGGWFRRVEVSPILGGMANFKILAAAAAAAVAGACGAFAAAPA
jgi:hypothetical protein